MSDVSVAATTRPPRPGNVVALKSAHAAPDLSADYARLTAEFAAVMQRRKECAPANLKPPVVDDPGIEQAVTDLMSAAELHDLPTRMARAAERRVEDATGSDTATTSQRSVVNALAWLARAQADRRRNTTRLVTSWVLTILVGGGMMLAVAIALFGLPADLAELQSTAARVLKI